MQIELRYLSEKDKKEICGWNYDGKYAMIIFLIMNK